MGEAGVPDYKNGGVAQLGEHLPCKQGVKSSNLSVSTVDFSTFIFVFLENRIQKLILNIHYSEKNKVKTSEVARQI